MQLLRHLAADDFSQRLARGELPLRVGPYIYNVQSNLPTVAAGIATLYGDFRLADPGEFVDYNVAIQCSGLLQRVRGKAEFLFDKKSPFDTIPAGQAYAFLEWGMNWCVSAAHQRISQITCRGSLQGRHGHHHARHTRGRQKYSLRSTGLEWLANSIRRARHDPTRYHGDRSTVSPGKLEK